MKTTLRFLLVSVLLLVAAGVVPAFAQTTVIYAQIFAGEATSLAGVEPTTGGNVWQQSRGNGSTAAALNADGSLGRINGSIVLPFTPQAGFVYTLTATLTFEGSERGGWVAVGFAGYSHGDSSTDSRRFSENSMTGYSWMRATNKDSGGVAATDRGYAGATVSNEIFNDNLISGSGSFDLMIKLDTRAPQWTTAMFVNEVQAGSTFAYASNPSIAYVGFSQAMGTSGYAMPTWDSFQLTATAIPEPHATAGLLGAVLAVAALGWRKRR